VNTGNFGLAGTYIIFVDALFRDSQTASTSFNLHFIDILLYQTAPYFVDGGVPDFVVYSEELTLKEFHDYVDDQGD